MSPQKNGRPRAVVACGGWAHPADETRELLVELIDDRGFDVVVVEEPEELTVALGASCDLLVVASCWFTMTQDRYTQEQRSEWGIPADSERQRLLSDLIDRGTPLSLIHI